jgi:hypothetical protein
MPFVQPALLYNLICTFVLIGPSLPCSVVMFTSSRSDTDVQRVAKTTHFPSALPLLRRSSAGAAEQHLAGARLGSHVGKFSGAHAVVERVYRLALRGTSPDYALLGEATGTQFRRFVDDLLQLFASYPNPELSPRSTDPQNLHLAFRKEILAIVGALVLNAAPASEPNRRNVKFREG